MNLLSIQVLVPPSTEAITEALNMVQAVVPDEWLVLADSQGFHFLLITSKKSMAIQREIILSYDGTTSVIVHCVKLEEENEIVKLYPEPVKFEKDDYKQFCTKGLTLCWGMQQFSVCCGADMEDAKHLWNETPDTYIDLNPYQETTYESTCRSNRCQRLIPKRFNSFRCANCASVLKNLKNRVKSAASGNVSAHTTNKNLTSAQAKEKLSNVAKELKNTKKKVSYLKSKIEKLEKLLEEEGVDIPEDDSACFRNILEKSNLSEEQQIFLDQQLAYSKASDPRAHRWHPAMIRFALKIKSHSTAAYEAMRDSGFIKLPHSRTLFDYSHCIDAKIGVNQDLLKMVVEDIQKVEERGGRDSEDQYHALIFDEMYVSQNLVYRKKDGALMGYAHLDEVDKEVQQFSSYIEGKTESRSLPLASTMLAFMVKGLTSNVKSVIAAYPCKDLNRTMIHARVWEVIEHCEGAGVKILVLVCDGSPNNRAFFKLQKSAVNTESGIVYITWNIFAEHGKRPLFLLADVAHLIKTIRNAFYKSREDCGSQFRCLQINGEKILWKTIVRLYYTFQGDTLREAFKLNTQNVFLTSYSVMKVKFAAQVLSQTVANVLKDMNWENTTETVKFIEIMNKFFDVLNGAHSSQAIKQLKPDLAPYSEVNDERFEWLMKDFWEDYILKWKQDNENLPWTASEIAKTMLPYQAIEGIEIAIRSFVGATKWLLAEQKANFIMARAFSQDPLEQDFSGHRAAHGGSTASNVSKFLRTQVDRALQGKLKSRHRKANVEDDLTSELSCQPLPKLPRRGA